MNYTCKTCGQLHDGLPAFGRDRPDQFWDVPEDRRDSDVFLTSDSCVIAERFFFIRGCIDIPIIGSSDSLSFGVWVSLKEENFYLWQDSYELARRSHIGPFFGWLSTSVSVYPNTLNLRANVHLRDNGLRPLIKLEPTGHPMPSDQAQGITLDQAWEYAHGLSGDLPGPPNKPMQGDALAGAPDL